MKRYPKLGITGTVLGILARKPEAFVEPDFNIIQATISWSQHQFKHVFSKMSISDRLPDKKLSEHGKGKVHGNFARKAEKTFSDIGKTIESGKRLYFSSIIGRTINYTRRPIKYGNDLYSLMFLNINYLKISIFSYTFDIFDSRTYSISLKYFVMIPYQPIMGLFGGL